MRVLAWILFATFVAVPVAHADDGTTDDEDGSFAPYPKRSVGFGLLIHGSRVDGMHTESGVGPVVEYAIGRDRWQYVGEVSLSSATKQTDMQTDATSSGKVVHGALGVRWLARQFRPDSSGGVELFLLSMLGGQRFYFSDGDRLARPELAAGFGLAVRSYKRPRLAFHLDARVVFTSQEPGYMTGFGFSW